METECERNDVFMFSDEHLGEMSGLERGRDTIQVLCGCICQSFGDALGRIKVFASGDFEISYECTPSSQEGAGANVELSNQVLLEEEDPETAAKICLLKSKISSNVSAMPVILKRMNVSQQ